jgi:membrane protease YdiL (CAAX protease family)
VKLLIGMDAAAVANQLVEANGKITLDSGTRVLLARALFASGASAAARRLLKAAALPGSGDYVQPSTLREMFELERDYGSTESAATAYRRLRGEGYLADPFGRHRVSLALQHPRAPWRMEDALGIGALVLVLCGFALLPLLVLAPLHYRSVIKQLRGQAPEPSTPKSPWSLRHAWYALAVLSVVGVATLYFMDYATFHVLTAEPLGLADQYEVLTSERQLGNAMLVASSVSFVALLPLVRGADMRALFLGHWSVKQSVLTAIGASVLLLLVATIVRLTLNKLPGAAVLGTDTTRGLQGIHRAYGAAALFVFVAGLIPIVEEFVFRGVLLRTVSRYFSLWIAVLVQAAVFMVWHEDATRYLYIFVLALIAAWLAQRSGGLLAPITLHATNNAFVAASLIGLARAFEHIK